MDLSECPLFSPCGDSVSNKDDSEILRTWFDREEKISS